MKESQNIEWKRSWQDKHLEWVCAFANAQGGTLIIGKNDDGSIHGLERPKKLLEDIPNKIRNHLGLTVDVDLHETPEGDFLEIRIPPHSVPVSFRGHYYYRTGSTKTELSGASLNEFLHRKSGRTWDASIEERATMDDIEPKSIARYLEDAADTGRLPDALRLNPLELLQKLRLARGDDLTCAALILFGKDPGAFYPGISIRIGRFGSSDTDLQFQEVIEGNLIHCLQEATEQLLGKFTIKPIHFKGMRRIETPQYPIEAIREVLLNAMVHRRYQSGVHVQIRVYADRLIAWNDGPLPPELSMEGLLGFHTSHPRNPLIAEACFKAGYIDSWGRGIEKIREACTQADLPKPEFDEFQGGMRVTLFAKSRLESGVESRLESGLESKTTGSEGGSDQSEGVKSGSDGEGPESESKNFKNEPKEVRNEPLPPTLEELGLVLNQADLPTRQDVRRTMVLLLEQIFEQDGQQAPELSETTGIPLSTAKRNLSKLKEAALIEYKGQRKYGGYHITELTHQLLKQS